MQVLIDEDIQDSLTRLVYFMLFLLELLWVKVGIKWVFILLKIWPEDDNPIDEDNLQEYLNEMLPTLKEENLQTVIGELENRIDLEEKRADKLETKAFSLIGLTSIVGILIGGLAQLTLTDTLYSPALKIFLTTSYITIGISLLMTIGLARQVIKAELKDTSPQVHNLWGLGVLKKDTLYRQHAKTVLQTYLNNHAQTNKKGTYVIAGQDWFRNTIVLLFLLLIVFGLQSVGSTAPCTSCEPPSTTQLMITDTLISPTELPTVTHSIQDTTAPSIAGTDMP